MKEPDEIDLLFQNGLDGLAFTPDPYVKENIDHAIASKKKRRRFLFILFPFLFALTGFAAIGLFYLNQSENKNQSQKEIHRRSVATDLHGTSSDGLTLNEHHSQKNSKSRSRITRHNSQTTNTSTSVKTASPQKIKNSIRLSGKLVPVDQPLNPETGFGPDREKIQPDNTSGKPADTIPEEEKILPLAENKPDSTLVPLPDSAAIAVSEALKHFGSNKGAPKWSLSVLTYWEGEKRRKTDFSDTPFVGNQGEIARVHASTFYVKSEIAYKLNSNLEILSGIGFRTSKVIQYGYLSTIILPVEGVSSGVPPINPATPDTTHRTEKQSFRINAIVLPIGLAYTFPITARISMRLSGGAELAYGKITSRFVHPDLSTPQFNPFGCSVWLRPEIHYAFGRTQLFGFGTFNQSLSQQLKWKVDSSRNPAFGAGIGLRIQL